MNVSSLNATIYVDHLTFSTGAPPADTTPPTVTSKTPANGATSVQIGQNAVAVFSEAVNGVGPSSFTLTPQGGSALAATVTYDAASKTAALDPNVDLLPNTSYTAQLTSAIKDAANNALVPVSWSFTTAAAADTTPPTVTSKTPAAGATGVAVAANITAQFSEAVTGVSGTSFTLIPQAGGTALAANVTYDSATKTTTLNPTADLAANTSYTAQLSGVITDAANNGMLPVSWSFTTGAAGGTFSFGADADTFVRQDTPTTPNGTSSSFSIVGGTSSARKAFIRFTVTGLPAGATISTAKLHLYVTNDSTSGGVFNRITSNSWAESITWNTQPAIDGTQLATLAAVPMDTFVDVDITAAITGNGTYSFAITLPAANTNTLAYASKEASTPANRPQLIVTTQ